MVVYNSFTTSHLPHYFVINATDFPLYTSHLLSISNNFICVSSSAPSSFASSPCCISHLQFTIAVQIIHMKCINCAMQLININRSLIVCCVCVCVLCTSQKWMRNFLLPLELRCAWLSQCSICINIAISRRRCRGSTLPQPAHTHTHSSSAVARWRCNQLCQNANAESQKSSASSSSRGNCDSGSDNSSNNNIVVGKSNLNKHKYIYTHTYTLSHTHTHTQAQTLWQAHGTAQATPISRQVAGSILGAKIEVKNEAKLKEKLK